MGSHDSSNLDVHTTRACVDGVGGQAGVGGLTA